MSERTEPILGVIGQALVDLIYSVDGSNAQVFGLKPDSHQHISSTKSQEIQDFFHTLKPQIVSGGSALNSFVAYQLLGGKGSAFFRTGLDRYAEIFKQELPTNNCKLYQHSDETLPTGHSLILSSPTHGRAMATCLGAADVFHANEVPEVFFKDLNALLVEGYMLLIDGDEFIGCYREAYQQGIRTVFSLSAPWIPAKIPIKVREALSFSSIAIANELEAESLTGVQSPEENVRRIASLLPANRNDTLVIITAGSEGAYLGNVSKVTHVPAVVTDVVDLTGAGDAFIGGFLFWYLRGENAAEAAHKAARLAAAVVARVGGRVTPEIARSF